jgi:hypothetical protein
MSADRACGRTDHRARGQATYSMRHFDIADLTGAVPGQQPGEARQRLHQAGKVRLGVAAHLDELHEVGLARLKLGFRQASAK